MFEDKTFEVILSDMLSYVSDRNSELDTRDGSMIYTALAPMALELETIYREMDAILEETFLETASKDYLVKHGAQLGVDIHEATYGTFKGEFDVDVPIGSRFNLDEFNYNVIEKLSDPVNEGDYYVFKLVCETEGAEPNNYFGTLTPITFVGSNLSHAELISVIIPGEDEEETESYRYRLQTHLKNPPIDGNVNQYASWLDEFDGIGKYKVVPCWNGLNTVKLIILDANNTKATDELITEVQNHFDPPTEEINDDVTSEEYPQGRGMGNGKAPIGAIVTVNTVTEADVVIDCTLTLKDGYTTIVGVSEAIEKYLKSIIFDKTNISYMALSAEIYKTECVSDVLNLSITVGGKTVPIAGSITLGEDEIAVLNTELSTWTIGSV